MSTRTRGAEGEDLAARFLIYKGLSVLARNYHCRYGEIDIIAHDGEITVFVEVKLRRNADFSAAADAVTPAKQERLRRTALFWMAEHGECPSRFDVIEIYDGETPPKVHWIRSAFE